MLGRSRFGMGFILLSCDFLVWLGLVYYEAGVRRLGFFRRVRCLFICVGRGVWFCV